MKGKRHETGKKWSQATPQQWSTTSTGTPGCHLKDIRKEGSVSVCAGMPSQVLGQREGSSYMEFNGLNLRLPLHSFFKTLGIWGIFFFIFLSLES